MAENSSSDAQPSSNNENTSSSARGARNNNNNNNNDNNSRNNYSRRQRQQFKGLYDEKFGGLTINNTNLTATHYQKFKAAVLSLVMTETTDGRNLYDDINKKVDTWTDKAEPARDDSDKLNADDIRQHRKKKERYLNNTLTMATMIMAQCDDYVKSLLRSKADYDVNHMSAVWVMKALHEVCSGVKPEEHPLEGDLKVIKALMVCKQYDKTSTQFHTDFKEALKALELRGCGFKISEQARDAEKALNSNLSDKEACKQAQERLISLLFLNHLKEKPTKLYSHLQGGYLQGTDKYPANSQQALELARAYDQPDASTRARSMFPSS